MTFVCVIPSESLVSLAWLADAPSSESVAAGFEAECESKLSRDQDPLPEHTMEDAVGSQNLRPGRLLRALEHVNNEDDM